MSDEAGSKEAADAAASASEMPTLHEPPSDSETPSTTQPLRSPEEQKWLESLPLGLQAVVEKHGADLFHFTLNRAALDQDLNVMSQLIRAKDAQERLMRVVRAVNMMIVLAQKGNRWTGEQHEECRKDIDAAIPQVEAPGSRLIVPSHLRH